MRTSRALIAGEDEEAKRVVAGLINDSGLEPVDVGGWAEAPCRDGAMYGEEYRPAQDQGVRRAAWSGPATSMGVGATGLRRAAWPRR